MQEPVEYVSLEEPRSLGIDFRLVMAVSGLIPAVWIGAGSVGLLTLPAARILTVVCMTFGLLMYAPYFRIPWLHSPLGILILVACSLLIRASIPLVSLSGIPLFLWYLVAAGRPAGR